MIKLFLDNVNISNNVEIDLSFVEKLDIELDEAFLLITHTNREEPFPMYGVMNIFEDNTLLFSGRIAQDNVEITSFSNEHYNHKISLIEHTKLLEKYLVTGKSFTQPIEDVGVLPYTLYDVLEILRTTTKLELAGDETFNTPFIIPNDLKEELEIIIAPEFNFKDVTLREALNEVFSYLDGIARIDKDSNIIIDKFNELNNQVNIISENYKRSQDISNYSTMMSSEISNPVNSEYGFNVNNTEYYPGKHLWTTLRSDELGQFNFESSFIPTPKPIYDIKEVLTSIRLLITKQMIGSAQFTQLIDDPRYVLDITDNVVERSIFNSLEDKDPETLDELTRRNVILYDYAKKGILVGLTYGLFDIETVFSFLINNAVDKEVKKAGFIEKEAVINEDLGDAKIAYVYTDENDFEFLYRVTWELVGGIDNAASFKRWESLFRVQYVPIPPSIRYEIARDDISEVFVESKSTINQKMRIVDLERFTANMKGKINQLGTSELILSHKVKNISQTFNIGDFTVDRFVITKKEVIVQRDHYIVNYELNKNFNKMSQFMGIDQEIRQYEIGESGRTIDRDLNYNEYIEVFADDSATLTPGTTTYQTPGLLLDTFDSSFAADKDLKYGLFTSPEVFAEGTQSPLKLNMPIYKISGGGAFGVYTDFETNVGASNRLEEGDGSFLGFADKRRYVFPVPYGDELGRFDTMFLSFYNNVLSDESTLPLEFEYSNDLPVFRKQEGTPIIEGEFFVKKDNRERIKFTLLYHLLPRNVNEVIIGEKLYTHNSLFIEEANTVILKKFTILGSNRRFTKRDFNSPVLGEDEKITNPNITINKNNMYIQIENSLEGVSSWALVDENNIPYLMVNGTRIIEPTVKKRVLFDFKSKREDIDQPGIPEPNRLLRPELESSSGGINTTTNVSSLTFNIGNPNNEVVTIQGVLGNQTVTEVALQNSSNNDITFTGLEPNTNFSAVFTILPVTESESLQSFSRTFSRTTPLPPVLPPTYQFVSYQITGQVLLNDQVNANKYSVTFAVTNPNNYQTEVISFVEGLNVTSGNLPATVIPANSTINHTVEFIQPASNFGRSITFPGSGVTLTNIIEPNMFALQTYTFEFSLRSREFTNNWQTPFGPQVDVFIDLEPTTIPEVTWVPSNLTGRLIFNVKNKDSENVKFAPGTIMRLNGQVIVIDELSDLVTITPATEIEPEQIFQIVIQDLVGGIHGASGEQNPFNVYQLQVQLVAQTKNISQNVFTNSRLAGKAKPPSIINIGTTSTNAQSFISFKLVNNERYTAQIFYATNTFSSNHTPTANVISLEPDTASNVLTYPVPSNNQNDLHYIHAYTDNPESIDFVEIREDSDVVTLPTNGIQPAALITQFTVQFFDGFNFDGQILKTVFKDDGQPLLSSDLPATPTKNGYDSSAWVNQDNQQYFVNFPVTKNLDWQRNWTPIQYNITYNLNGGTNDGANPSTYDIEDAITLQPASRLGYDFNGWYLEPGFATQVTSIPLGSTGNITLYAKLDVITLDNAVFTFNTTIDSITMTITNPSSNPRLSTDGAITYVKFGVKRFSDGAIVDGLTTEPFPLPGDELVKTYTGLDVGTQYVVFGDGSVNSATDGITTLTLEGDFVPSVQPSITVSTLTPVGDKLLRVRMAAFGTTTNATVSWSLNSTSQGNFTVNNSTFTTLSSTLFDNDTIALTAPLNYLGGTLQGFVVNGTFQSVLGQTITLTVNNGLEIEPQYS